VLDTEAEIVLGPFEILFEFQNKNFQSEKAALIRIRWLYRRHVSVCGVCIGMIPLWLFTLGQLIISDDVRITIPYVNILIILACYLIPVIIGLLIQRHCKRLSAINVRCLRPMYVVFILCMFTFGVWTNLYVFRLIRPLLLLAGSLLPYVGFVLSGTVAWLFRQPPARILTIAIETAIQNTGLPIVLMKFSLPQPDADLSVVGPVVIAMFMPMPLWVTLAVTSIRRRSGAYFAPCDGCEVLPSVCSSLCLPLP